MTKEYKVPYGVNSQKAAQLVFAGLIATVVMLAFSYLLKYLSVDAIDFSQLYGAIVNGQADPGALTAAWWAGLASILVNGIVVFSFLYDFLAHQMILPSKRYVKGLFFGLGTWLVISAIVAPIAGQGFFYRFMANPLITGLSCLASLSVYGLTLDAMTRVRAVHRMGIVEKSAA